MTKDTKRVDDLEVGDVVIFPQHKEPRTIFNITPPSSLNNKLYVISTVETQNTVAYIGHEKVIYLGSNKKEEETMTTQKVDCSALYPYFDTLANEEVSLKGATNIPVYVRQQLKHIHELFEDVLGLTLEEVKTLYFKRKMSKEKKETTKTKKVYELLSGDVVIEPNCNSWKIVSKVEIANKESGVYRVFYETDSPPNLGTHQYHAIFTYLHNVGDLEGKKEKPLFFITKRVKELCIGDKIHLSSPVEVVEITGLKKIIPNHIRFEWEDSYRTFLEDVLVDVLKE